MEPCGRYDHERAHVLTCKQRLDGLAAGRTQLSRDAVAGRTVRIRHGKEPRVLDASREILRVATTHEADADHTDADEVCALQRRPSARSISCIRTYPMTDSR
jgi:hypothetical protein